MKVLVVGCEPHIFRLIETNLQRSYPVCEIAEHPDAPELRPAILKHKPSHMIASDEETANLAYIVCQELGITVKIYTMDKFLPS